MWKEASIGCLGLQLVVVIYRYLVDINVEDDFRFGLSEPWTDEDGNYDVVLETVSL